MDVDDPEQQPRGNTVDADGWTTIVSKKKKQICQIATRISTFATKLCVYETDFVKQVAALVECAKKLLS